MLKASHSPLGDQPTLPTGSSSAVTSFGKPPLTEMVQTSGTPVIFETNASCLPSGEKLGDEQEPMRAIRVTERSSSSAAAPIVNGAIESKSTNDPINAMLDRRRN